jgi:hypothetical protein
LERKSILRIILACIKTPSIHLYSCPLELRISLITSTACNKFICHVGEVLDSKELKDNTACILELIATVHLGFSMPDIKSEYETIEELEKAIVENEKKEDILISERKL